MKTTIYALRENGFVRYVGKTKYPLENRLGAHLQDARKGVKTYKCDWIRSLLRRGLAPTITTLEVVEGDGNKDEKEWIAYFCGYGIRLTNGTEGGDGGETWTRSNRKEEIVKLISDANKLAWQDPEYKADMKRKRKEKWLDPLVRKRHEEASRKSNADPVVRAKISASLEGIVRSKETCERMSKGRSGIAVPLERRQRIRESVKKLWTDPGYRKRSVANIRRTHSREDFRLKQKESAKRLWRDPEYRARMVAAHKKK